MRIPGPCGLSLAVLILATGCSRKLTPQEAASLLTRTYSNSDQTAHFTCQDGERDWLYICYVRKEPTPIGIQQGGKPSPAERVGIKRIGTYQGEPILFPSSLPSDGPVPSQAEHATWQKAEMARQKAQAEAQAAKSREITDRVAGK